MNTPTPISESVPQLALEEARREAAAAERQRLARALHDTVAQSLTATYFFARQIEMHLAKDSPELSAKMASLGNLISQACSEVQSCIQGLESDGLPPSGREESSACPGSRD